MRKVILNLRMFAGGHSVTVVADGGFSACSASATTDVAKDTEVTISTTLASGYQLDEFEVLQGGVTVNPSTGKFTMGEANVVIAAKSKSATGYIVTEDTVMDVNGTRVSLKKNISYTKAANGAIIGVNIAGGGTEVTSCGAAVTELIKSGVLVHI